MSGGRFLKKFKEISKKISHTGSYILGHSHAPLCSKKFHFRRVSRYTHWFFYLHIIYIFRIWTNRYFLSTLSLFQNWDTKYIKCIRSTCQILYYVGLQIFFELEIMVKCFVSTNFEKVVQRGLANAKNQLWRPTKTSQCVRVSKIWKRELQSLLGRCANGGPPAQYFLHESSYLWIKQPRTTRFPFYTENS